MAGMNKIGKTKQQKKINDTYSLFLEKIDGIDKLLGRLRRKGEMIQTNNFRNVRGWRDCEIFCKVLWHFEIEKKKKTSNSIQLIAFYSGYFTGREDWADGDTVRQPVFPRSGTQYTDFIGGTEYAGVHCSEIKWLNKVN